MDKHKRKLTLDIVKRYEPNNDENMLNNYIININKFQSMHIGHSRITDKTSHYLYTKYLTALISELSVYQDTKH